VYFQAVLEANPLTSGVDLLPIVVMVAPFALVGGVIIQVLKRFVPSNVVGNILQTIGIGLYILLTPHSHNGEWFGYQVVQAVGTGLVFSGTVFLVLAPLPVEDSGVALAALSFIRAFGQSWGVTISGTILQNGLRTHLPPEFSAQFQSQLNVEIAFAAIPLIPTLPEPLKSQVKVAFTSSLALIWEVLTAIAGVGVLSVFLLKEIPMHEHNDEKFALQVGNMQRDEEREVGSGVSEVREV